jgi:mono/diheme cytochrome c family protein
MNVQKKLQITLPACVLIGTILAAQETKSQLEGIYSIAQAKRGESTYLQNCAPCHGANLRGAEGGPALSGPDFNSKWESVKLRELLALITMTMPQSAPGSLAERQYTDVLAFILFKNDFPAGQTDLSGQSEVLSGIVYQLPKR